MALELHDFPPTIAGVSKGASRSFSLLPRRAPLLQSPVKPSLSPVSFTHTHPSPCSTFSTNTLLPAFLFSLFLPHPFLHNTSLSLARSPVPTQNRHHGRSLGGQHTLPAGSLAPTLPARVRSHQRFRSCDLLDVDQPDGSGGAGHVTGLASLRHFWPRRQVMCL